MVSEWIGLALLHTNGAGGCGTAQVFCTSSSHGTVGVMVGVGVGVTVGVAVGVGVGVGVTVGVGVLVGVTVGVGVGVLVTVGVGVAVGVVTKLHWPSENLALGPLSFVV